MGSEFSDEEWSEFKSVVVKVLESHQNANFIETIAVCLGNDVYNQFRHWKTSNDGLNADCAKKTRYVLDTWKSKQTNFDRAYLIQEFDKSLSEETLANELRTKVKAYFSEQKKENGNH